MRHKTAARLADGSGWHYVSSGRPGAGHPIGRCAHHAPHPTEAEARECYGAFVREATIRLNVESGSWSNCSATIGGVRCPNPTRAYATFGDDGYGTVRLCPDHMTTENVIAVAGLDGPAGDAWLS